MSKPILTIEDEKNIQELLKFTLEQAGYRTVQVFNGRDALESAKRNQPVLILLDLMLPQLDGVEVCKILKNNEATAHIPIIMLTAKSQEIDKVIGLELGADDYITKPFSPRELTARVKAVLRRSSAIQKPIKTLSAGHLHLDVEKRMSFIKKKSIEFTVKEFDLLRTLLEAKGRVLSREYLLETVWGYESASQIETRTVDMHILQIRKKIDIEAERLITAKGIGYRFNCD